MSNHARLSAVESRKQSTSLVARHIVAGSPPELRSLSTTSIEQVSEITFLRLPQVKATTGLSKTTIYEKIKDNAFPCPVLISKRAVAWIESEVRQWAASQVSATRAVNARIPPKRVSFSRPRLPIAKTA